MQFLCILTVVLQWWQWPLTIMGVTKKSEMVHGPMHCGNENMGEKITLEKNLKNCLSPEYHLLLYCTLWAFHKIINIQTIVQPYRYIKQNSYSVPHMAICMQHKGRTADLNQKWSNERLLFKSRKPQTCWTLEPFCLIPI